MKWSPTSLSREGISSSLSGSLTRLSRSSWDGTTGITGETIFTICYFSCTCTCLQLSTVLPSPFRIIVLPAELSAAAVLINYWISATRVSNAAWISICLVVVIVINLFGARAYGEAEFWFASIKVITITGLIVSKPYLYQVRRTALIHRSSCSQLDPWYRY